MREGTEAGPGKELRQKKCSFYLFLSFFPSRAARPKEVFLIEIFRLDFFCLLIAFLCVFVRKTTESFNVHPACQVHAGIIIRQELAEMFQLHAVVDELVQRVVTEFFWNVFP